MLPALSPRSNTFILLQQARLALQRGNKLEARRLATQAAALAPEMEDPWLLLAAVAHPRASIVYLQRALQINPGSPRARTGMEWAVKRLQEVRSAEFGVESRKSEVGSREEVPGSVLPPSLFGEGAGGEVLPRRNSRLLWLLPALILLCLASALAAWAWQPVTAPIYGNARQAAIGLVFTATASEIPTETASPTSTEMPTATSTATETPTPTFTPTDTPTATFTPTDTPLPSPTPTDTPTPPPAPTPTATVPPPTIVVQLPPTPAPTPRPPKPSKRAGPEARPDSVGQDERWVDVDLSSQTAYAMQGDQVINSFLVSTGLYPHTTVTGVYRIYVKYRYADMYGEDYNLADVPYVMYFYEGYGLHGTYWHHNFGHPMSHGCVNMRTADAGWMYEYTVVGTVVSVHQ